MDRDLFLTHARVEQTHWWFTGRRAILREVLHRVAPPGRGTPLLDVGCGTGGNAAAFADDYAVLGLDPAPDSIALAKERFPAVQFVQAEGPEAGRDHLAHGGVLLMTDVLEHVADDLDLFRRTVAVVPSGGHLVITVPADPSLWSAHDVTFGHFRRYTLPTLQALWQEAPVEVRLCTPFNARLRPLVALIRRSGWRSDGGNDLTIPSGPLNGLLHRLFASEAPHLANAIDQHRMPWRNGVSLMAVLRVR